MAKASDNVFPKVYYGMNTADVAAPSDSRWEMYSKANGIFARSSNTIVGPLVDQSSVGAPNNSGLTLESSIQGISDYVSAYDTSAAATRGFPVYALQMGRQLTVMTDECRFDSSKLYGGFGSQNVSGTGAALSAGTSTGNHPGVTLLSSGTTTTGRCCIIATGDVTFWVPAGSGKQRFGCTLKITTLSDGTNTFTARMGIGSLNTGDGDGIYFRYTNGTNSGKWQGVSRASAVESTTDTGSTADTSFHTFEYEVNAAGTSIQFYIDGAAAGSAITTNIPTAAGNITPASIVKSAGTTARTLELDAFWIAAEFTTAR